MPDAGARRGSAAPYVVAVVAGMALWFAASLAGGRREAWDGPVYWSAAYPLAILVAAMIGHLWPDRPWRAVLLLFAAQFVAMCIRNGEVGNLWPLGLALFAVLALPAILAAKLAARYLPRRR
jgi:hypothetical protein